MQVAAWMAFLLAAGFVLYALAGYPLLLWILARFRPKRVQRQFQAKTVTILLPVHNGEQWLSAKLQSILALDYPCELLQIVVLSDGSTDGTDAIARDFSAAGVELIRLPKGGKAKALNRGMQTATGEILFFTDVRQPLAPDCLRRLTACFADPQVGGACGELVILDGETHEEASVGLYWTVEKWIRRQLSAMGTLLVVTGCVYAIRRELAEPVPAGSLGDDIFLPQAVLRKGYRVVFEEGAKAFDYPTAHDVEFRRKVRTLAALYQYAGRYGFGRHWFHFFSYKITRLLLPYAFIALAVSSLFLPRPFAVIAITGQAVFYLCALLNPWIPEQWSFKRVSSPARTFCMLMAASLSAVCVLFVPASKLWATTQVRAPKHHA
jgi:cellulose synthase/poly-beta-1,6-N-acetylglucosamine synthase-like glycosyltransferase